MENVDNIRQTIRDGKCCFGTLDSWILWNLTGGLDDGVHITDVTNASRTMLMNLGTLNWDSNLCTFFQIPTFILPKIRSSAERYGYVCDGPLKGVPIMAVSMQFRYIYLYRHSVILFFLMIFFSVWANNVDHC